MEGFEKRPSRLKARQSLVHVPSASRVNGIEKQNATVDLSAARAAQESSTIHITRRTRGKSLGPGGLEALRETDGNTSRNANTLQPRSILKPTVPLTPPKNIPTFDELRQKSTRKQSPTKTATEALLIDFSTPGPSRDSATTTNMTAAQSVFDPFSPAKLPEVFANGQSRSDEVDEEDRVRQEHKRAILEQRAARRKSLANRRVSFAPEATLHTWSVMEMVEDSTTSSTSNSTRRQSSMTTQQTPQRQGQSSHTGSDASNPPSTPPDQAENPLIKASPARQSDSQQKKRRRSSAISEDMDALSDEAYSSSPSGDVAAESSPIRVEDSIDSDSDTDGDTAMSMDELTQNTVRSQSDSDTQSSLEERLRQAANQAGTKGIDYDEHGDDLSMEIANDTVTNAFQPWARGQQLQRSLTDDQEDVKPFLPAQRAHAIQAATMQDDEEITQGMTMDITRAVGGILGGTSSSQKSRRKSVAPRRRSSVGRVQSELIDSSYEDESMDLTTVAGGILSAGHHEDDSDREDLQEDMTMELTMAVGGLQHRNRRESVLSIASDDGVMDMTAAVGGILAPIEEQTEPQTDIDESTMTMEMTKAAGRILPQVSTTNGEKHPIEDTIVYPMIENSPEISSSLQTGEEMVESTPNQLTSIASETGSPSLAFKPRSGGRTRSGRVSQAATPKSSTRTTPQKVSSIKRQTTPTKQLTPVPARAKTPERTPISARITPREVTPKKLFQAEIQARASPVSTRKSTVKQHDPLFAQDEATGRQTPRVVLHAPKSHQNVRVRSSGIGIDREGFGSPSVTQLLARRSSIGDAAPEFKLDPSLTPRIRFEDPKQIVLELAAERAEDERRESGRFLMEQEANAQQDENTTSQLKDMIESMSPRKGNGGKFKGRKSLAVGSARGLLGKRPVELDDEDDDGDTTPKRLKAVSRDGSPVKKVHLPKPPSKEETTGRLSRAERRVLENVPGDNLTPAIGQSPSQANVAKSPQQSNRYRDIPQDISAERPTSFEDKLDNVVGAVDPLIEHLDAGKAMIEEDKISLQQFLNMTNIHFIELNATKRRHTMAQTTANETTEDSSERSNFTKASFIAAATTMPLLDLYQHATRELKSYISTGRKIIRSIENETLTEQPALFREYVDARPDIRLAMDNQFRNGKTNARLQSKEGWYTWRSQLVDGLRTGLEGIRGDMQKDLVVVEEQANAICRMVPELTNHCDALAAESSSLQQRLDNINSVDYEFLKTSRRELRLVDNELEAKLAMLGTLQQQMHDKEEALSQAAELKEEMQGQIAEANRVHDEYRGWAVKDVLAAKARVNAVKEKSSWALISAEEHPDEPHDFGVALTMSYKNLLRLFFYPSAYQQAPDGMRRRSGRTSQSVSGVTAPISLTYLPLQEDDATPPQLPTEQRFFLQLVQSQLHSLSMMPKDSISARMILDTVSSGWEIACSITEEIRLLNLAGVTRVSIRSDEKLSTKLMLIKADRSRIDIEFTTTVAISEDSNIFMSTSVTAKAVYGPVTSVMDASKTRKVQAALSKEIENRTTGKGSWIGAIQGFEEWYCVQMQIQKPAAIKQQKVETTLTTEQEPSGSTTPKSPAPNPTRTPATKRSPLASRKPSTIQKKIPVSISRQDKFRTSQREQALQADKMQTQGPISVQGAGKENVDPFGYGTGTKAPAITPEMQEAMMQRTPIKRVGALRRSPI